MAERKDEKPEDLKQAHEQQEKARAVHKSEVSGAQSVAEAVKRVADGAVAAAQRAGQSGPVVGNFVVSGSPGGRFTIRGDGFTGSGTVSLNGVQLVTDEWGGQLIRGKLPADAKSGEVVVRIDEKTEQRGYLRV